MSREIEINFNNALMQANALENLAGEIRGLSGNYADTMNAISANWNSENSVIYLNKGALLNTSIGNTASDLEIITRNIRSTARRIYEAEKEAERLAAERLSKNG